MSFPDVCPERAPRSLEAPGIVFEEPRRGPEQPSCHVDKQKSLAGMAREWILARENTDEPRSSGNLADRKRVI